MRTLILIISLLPMKIEMPNFSIPKAECKVSKFAVANGFKPSKSIVKAIYLASRAYNINELELSAIAIVETGFGSNVKVRKNSNGTLDKGLFQINTVNWSRCSEYNIDTLEGSSLCAAKLLSRLKSVRSDYLAAYHSKTPSKKLAYQKKLSEIFVKGLSIQQKVSISQL